MKTLSAFVLLSVFLALPTQAPQKSEQIANFVDIAEKAGLTSKTVFGGTETTEYIIEMTGTGVAIFDYDNDGWPDIFLNALATQRYALFRNVKGAFDYVSDSTGVGAATMLHSGWGAKFIDFDNDGWKDLFVAQGHVMDNVQLTRADLRYLEAPLELLPDIRAHSDEARESGAWLSALLAPSCRSP